MEGSGCGNDRGNGNVYDRAIFILGYDMPALSFPAYNGRFHMHHNFLLQTTVNIINASFAAFGRSGKI